MSVAQKPRTILIVDDEPDIRNLIAGILGDEGYAVQQAGGAKGTYDCVERSAPDLVILDIWLEGSNEDGLKILKTLKASYPFLPVVMISGHADISTAVSAIKEGAYDFIEKPFKTDRLLLMVRRALESAALKRENHSLKTNKNDDQIPSVDLVGQIDLWGEGAAVSSLLEALKGLAIRNSRALLIAEPGVNKIPAAWHIHEQSERSGASFVVMNSALTAITMDKVADYFTRAMDGTLFIDHIEVLDAGAQKTVLKCMYDTRDDVRVLAGTNMDLTQAVEDYGFSQTLYERLNVASVCIPPLKERKSGLRQVLAHRLPGQKLSREALEALEFYNWPGNDLELEYVLAHIKERPLGEKSIKINHLPAFVNVNSVEGGVPDRSINLDQPLRDARESFEKAYIEAQLDRFDGHISNVAQFIGMERSALHRKLKSLNIQSTDVQAKRKAS